MELEMSTKAKSEGFERVHIEEGVYTAELIEVKDISDGQYGPRVAFIYKILPDNKELAYVAYKVIATAENKLGKALIAHGKEIEDGKVDTDNLPTKTVKVWVEDFETEKDGKKETGSTISKVKTITEKVGE